VGAATATPLVRSIAPTKGARKRTDFGRIMKYLRELSRGEVFRRYRPKSPVISR